jgi:hypothetical protein
MLAKTLLSEEQHQAKKEQQRRYREKNRERLAEYSRAYRKKNADSSQGTH